MEYKHKLNIKDWAVEDRPREKLIKKGVIALSDAEILALLIGSGNRNETAVELSKRILKGVDHNLNEMGRLSIHDLQKYKGIGEAKAIAIAAAMELGKRRKLSEIVNKKQIKSSRDVYERFQPKLLDLPYEEFWVLLLNRANRIIDEQKISQGGVTGTVTDVKIILKQAIEKLATGIILCHNHPSGNIRPSKADSNITQKLKNASVYLDIQVVDHVIVGQNTYYSYADEGIL
ncbi:MAG: DNA repair protein RadC [Bacteroidales bacterium]|nr:DNA repair protein RadC [Bacteroidales bacterium]